MKEQLVKFETAKLAKEKGFNEPVLYHYLDDEGEGTFILTPNESHFSTEVKMVRGVIDVGETNNVTTTENLYDIFNEEIEWYISAPTQSLLQKWLREVHDIHIEIRNYQEYDKDNYAHTLNFTKNANYKNEEGNKIGQIISRKYFDIYEEALEEGLYQALLLI